MSFLDKMLGKKSDKEVMRENDKALRKVGRDLERERMALEREEKKLILDIKKAAKENNKETCSILAKQLVQLRKQKQRTYVAGSKVQTVQTSSKLMASNAKVGEVLKSTTKTMGDMNKIVNPAEMNKTLQEFSKQSTKMEMTDEMINDTLDDIMNESGDEEESEDIVNKVLDEIGIEMSGKLAQAPSANRDKIGVQLPDLPTDTDLEERIARLKN